MNITSKQIVWEGEENRELFLHRPCSCGCDTRDGDHGVGYLTGSNSKGEGLTIWIESEEVFQRLKELMNYTK